MFIYCDYKYFYSEAGTNPPTGSWVSPASGNRTAAASSYRFPAASSVSPSGVRAPSEKPGDFRGIPASGASARPQEPKKLTHLEEALSMPAFAGGNIPVCNVDNMPIKLVTDYYMLVCSCRKF